MSHPQSALVVDGKAIRNLRDRAGYTLRGFAHELGIEPSHLSRVERDHRKPGIELRNRIAHKLGVDIDEIVKRPEPDSIAA